MLRRVPAPPTSPKPAPTRLGSIAFLSALALALPAAAQTRFQDTTAIDTVVEGFTGHPIGVEGGARSAVDKRLKLAACPTVALAWHGANHEAVLVSCGNPGWRLFVPLIASTAPTAPAPAQAAAAIAAAPAKREIVIKRGDPVTIEVNAQGFSIARDGVAMTDAAAGARLLVNVDGPRKPVQAIALESGRATLPGWAQ
ncbi:MAG: flagella basal body P-ring formation protein FlgA [Sphingomonas sp.]|nr:flagella basal body P-ring formation protein FlgA [Sphingomonas sp.]